MKDGRRVYGVCSIAACIWALQAGACGQVGWDSLVWRQKGLRTGQNMRCRIKAEMQDSVEHALEVATMFVTMPQSYPGHSCWQKNVKTQRTSDRERRYCMEPGILICCLRTFLELHTM